MSKKLRGLYEILISYITALIAYAIKGFTLKLLWTWFIIPVFHIRELQFIECIGIFIVIDYVFKTHKKSQSNKDLWGNVFSGLENVIFTAIAILPIGWIISLFI